MKNKRIYKAVELEIADCLGNKYTTIDNFGKKGLITFSTIEEAQKRCDEYNSTYYLSNYSNDEILDYFNSVDFKPLLKKIDNLIGLELTYDINVKKNRFDTYEYFEIESKENLVNNFPILLLAWNDFKVSTFNGVICCDKKTGELSLWCTINFLYQHYDFGTNGARIITAWYKENKWIIETEKEKYNK